MLRTLSSALLTEIGATITEPLWLVEIQAVSATYRLNSWDQVISWNSQVWVPYGLAVDGLTWDGKARRGGRVTLFDVDLTWWTLALNDELSARPVKVWQAYFGAPADAVPMFYGRTGGPQRDDANTVLDLLNDKADKQRTPRDRIGITTGATQLVPAGTIFYLGGVKYTLERPKA
jgi:hypothetical protein